MKIKLYTPIDDLVDVTLIYQDDGDGLYMEAYELNYIFKIGSNYYCYACNNEGYDQDDWTFNLRVGQEPLEMEEDVTGGIFYSCPIAKHDTTIRVKDNEYFKYKLVGEKEEKLSVVKFEDTPFNYQRLIGGESEIFTDDVFVEFTTPVKLSFEKQDFNGKNLSGATISVNPDINTVQEIKGIKNNCLIDSNNDGKFDEITVYPKNNTGSFTLTLHEEAPSGCEGLPSDVALKVEYDKKTGNVLRITESSDYIISSGSTVTIKNKPLIEKLVIEKVDALDIAQKIEGVTFNITLSGIESIKGSSGASSVITRTTNEEGQIVLEDIVLAQGKNAVTITLVETGVPEKTTSINERGHYYLTDGTPIVMTLTYSNVDGKASWAKTVNPQKGTSISCDEQKTNSGLEHSITIKNQPYMDITGMVWEDGQSGEKNVQGPNGNKDNGEQGLGGVQVRLYNEGTKTTNGQSTYTLNDGTYSFTNVPKTEEGYRVIFDYDGINWQETKSLGTTGTDSKPVKEYYKDDKNTRQIFNDRFKEIENGKAIATNKDETPLSYTYKTSEGKSVLNVTMDGKNPKNGNSTDFRMSAITNVYTDTTYNVGCGLVKKNFDLAIGTDVKEAILTINDKTTTYTYQQILNGDLDKILQNNSSTAEDVIYNLYLYASDYNYRIDDYRTDIGGNTAPGIEEDGIADYEGLKKLEAYVTYNITLFSQTSQPSTVEQFVYYYDSIYTPVIKNEEGSYENLAPGDMVYGYTVTLIKDNKITFEPTTHHLNVLKEENGYRKEINLTFRINEKPDGSGLEEGKTATNIAEITSYSTENGGLIDRDSEPGNTRVTFEAGTPMLQENQNQYGYEDDTDEAKGLNIILRTNETRTIKGTVFDDTGEKDGMLNNSNAGINNVIVQLIEIKEIAGQYYEYIWQETVSGSNEVKATAEDGYHQEKYTNSVQAGSGMYEFKDFIPGNYIIRFIYGDGRTYNVDSEEYKNVAKYNGQDYKSTIDLNYNRIWYNTSPYTAGESVARDNEARRLEVMTYSTRIDSVNGQALKDKTPEALERTWMCAETSRINIPVDAYDKTITEVPEGADTTSTENSSTQVVYNYTKENEAVLFGNMNFGLALRPQNKITLEKHITGLKITPSGAGTQSIVDAKVTNIADIVNGTEVTVQGITQGLATIKSIETDRGFWQVATDVEELLQGADLEVEYTYVIRNDGEKDYLSKTLVDVYLEKDIETYNSVLSSASEIVKDNMKNGTYSYKGPDDLASIGDFLGISYYTGAEFNDDFVDALTQMDVNGDGRANVRDIARIQQYLLGEDISINGRGDIYADGEVNNLDITLFCKYINGWDIEDWGDLAVQVPSKIEAFEEAVNNDLTFNNEEGIYFEKVNSENVSKTVYNVAGEAKTEDINTVIKNTSTTTFLLPKIDGVYTTQNGSKLGSVDWSKKVTAKTTLATVSGGEFGANIPSYIAEITQYTNAAGRKDMDATPGNLGYVHSNDNTMTIQEHNERDEFWGESKIITKPTGEDKITSIQIVIITTAAIATLGVGILLIKKLVLKKITHN